MARRNGQAARPLTLHNDGLACEYHVQRDLVEADAAQPRRVLLIEDHPVALTLLAMWLAERGFEVQEFKNLKQALQSLEGQFTATPAVARPPPAYPPPARNS